MPNGCVGLEYYQISQIQDAARRFGLPDMEFAGERGLREGGGVEPCACAHHLCTSPTPSPASMPVQPHCPVPASHDFLPFRAQLLAVGFGDISRIRGEDNGGLCPLLIYCKTPSHYDILIPDGQFTQYVRVACQCSTSRLAALC